MKITRYAIKLTHSDGSISWHTQGLPSNFGDFAFAILYSTPEHGRRARTAMLKKYPGLASMNPEIVPVTVEVQL